MFSIVTFYQELLLKILIFEKCKAICYVIVWSIGAWNFCIERFFNSEECFF